MTRPDPKWQTRLTFSPLPSSSPAAAKYPEQNQERAASVGYDSPRFPSRKRDLGNAPSDRTMLSPASSSSVPGPPGDFIVAASQGRTKRRKTAMFVKATLPTPVTSSQTDTAEKDPIKIDDNMHESFAPNNKPTPVSRRLFARRKQPILNTDDSSSDELTVARSTPAKPTRLSTHSNAEFKEGNEPIDLGLTDEDRLQTMVISSSEDETDHLERVAQTFSPRPSPNTPTTPPTSRPKSSQRARPRRVISSPSSDSGPEPNSKDQLPSSPIKSKRSRNSLKTGRGILNNEGDKCELPKNQRSTRLSTMAQRQQQIPRKSRTAKECSSFSSEDFTPKARNRELAETSSLSGDSDGDSIEGKKRNPRERRSRNKPVPITIPDDDSASSEAVAMPMRKRRLTRAGGSSLQVGADSEGSSMANEVLEDVDDLKGTEVRSHRTRATNRTPKKSKFQHHLEILKRRRAGQKVVDIASDSEDSAKNSPNFETHELSDEQASDGSLEEVGDERQSAHVNEDLDQYDEDFVVEDDNAAIGVPADFSEMPLEFSRHAHKKPIEHFKDAVEWMIHNRLNPAFARDDPVYHIAVQKLDDEVQGLAGSKFMSAAWNADFMSTLKARPDISYLDAPGLFEHHCAACNRSNHPAKFQLIFGGKPYNRQSLEEISGDEDDEYGTDGQDGFVGHDEKTFYVGRTCSANAETAHALHHWRFALNQWVLEWLGRRGHTSAAKVLERERWTTKKRTQYANDVVDGMETAGEMRVLYKEFKENLQAARNVKAS